jgi:hypothetical protein
MERSEMDFAWLKNGTIDSGHPFFTLTYFKEGKPVLVSESGGKINE